MRSYPTSLPLVTVCVMVLALACDKRGSQKSPASAPYKETEITFRNPNDGIHFSATLTLPERAQSLPAVVLIHGSGPHRRDAEIGKHRLFFVLADYLSRHGVAVLRYDKRGCGQSGGRFEPHDIENAVGDALAGIDFLKTQEAIDPKRIGALGISLGGLVVPRMAVRSPDVRFAVLMAAPGVWGKEFFCLSSVAIARASGFSEQDLVRIRGLYDELWPLWAKSTLSVSETTEAVGILRELNRYMDEETRTIFHLEDAAAYFAFMRSPHILEFLDHNPADILKQVQCPVLAINGSKDVQVTARENLAAIESALREGGNHAYKVVEIDGLNHVFQRCQTGLPHEYFSNREAMAPEALEMIRDWILTVTTLN